MNAPLRTAPVPPDEIDASGRVPLLALFIGASIWLIISSCFALIASLKFHSPNFLAATAWLTYGRVVPAATNALLYGFCIPAGLACCLWLLARLGRIPLAQPWLILVGSQVWNLGLTLGIVGILAGDTTGFETLELPRYAAPIIFLGYLIIALWGLVTFHQRRPRELFVSQWFILAALFWFAWIYATAELLLVVFPVRGVTQSIIAWWYAHNLIWVWFSATGLAAIFYFIPKLTNRELHSRYLALIAFWVLLLCGSWGGIPTSAPVPAWLPALSTVAVVLTLFCVAAVVMNLSYTLGVSFSQLLANPTLRFIGFGAVAFVVAAIMNACAALPSISRYTDLTWFTTARVQLQAYGFFAMTMFGVAYHIVPQLTGLAFPSTSLVRWHFRLAAFGIVVFTLVTALGGVVQGIELQDASVPFMKIVKTTLHFLRLSTLGDLALAAGHVLFFVNLAGLARRFYGVRAASAYASVTAQVQPAGATP